MTLDSNETELLWCQKYRPQTVSETILPEKTKKAFQQFVDSNSIPNLLLTGTAGTGKTTVAMAMLEQLDCDYIMINGSLNGGIDTLRYSITNFASSVSFTGGRKYVIIDESDYLNANSTQPGLRSFMEEYSRNCGFIFTCNFKNRIIEPLRSRLSEIDFTIEKSERPKLAAQFYKRILTILKEEQVEFDQKTVAKVVEKYFPDFRRTLNELQLYAGSGKIDEGIFVDLKQGSIETLFELLKGKNFTEMRKWCAQNADQDANELFRAIYDMAADKVEMKSMPGFVVTLGDYAYKQNFVADPEINMVAFLTEVMMEAQFK